LQIIFRVTEFREGVLDAQNFDEKNFEETQLTATSVSSLCRDVLTFMTLPKSANVSFMLKNYQRAIDKLIYPQNSAVDTRAAYQSCGHDLEETLNQV